MSEREVARAERSRIAWLLPLGVSVMSLGACLERQPGEAQESGAASERKGEEVAATPTNAPAAPQASPDGRSSSAPVGASRAEVSLGTGEETSKASIDPAATVKLRGTVVDLDGAPVVGARVRVSQSAPVAFDDRTPRTDAKGGFELAGVPAGEVRILVVGPHEAAVDYNQATLSTKIAGGPEVELPPIRLAPRRLKAGEAEGDLGFAILLGGATTSPSGPRIEVAAARPGGPAAAAGLRVGDVIVRVDGEDVTGERRYLYEQLTRVSVGTTLRLGLARGDTVELTAVAPP